MFTENLAAAIQAAPLNTLSDLSAEVWRAYGAGDLSDDAAQQLQEQIEARRSSTSRTPGRSPGETRYSAGIKRYIINRSPEQRSPDKIASLERRRKLANSGHMPLRLAALFTFGELANLKIISDEWLAHGLCDLSVNEIAARAGTCRETTKRTVWLAEIIHGFITVERRPRSGRKHLTNIIRIIRADWIDWLSKGNRRAAAAAACLRAKPDFRFGQRIKYARRSNLTPPRGQHLISTDQRAVKKSAHNPWHHPLKRE